MKKIDKDYRSTHLTNDGEQRGERDNGRSLPRRNNAQKAIGCEFKFTVKCDEFGYYITLKRGGGNPTHSNHPQYDDTPLPPRLFTENKEKEDLKSLHSTSCGNGVCSAHLLNRYHV